MECDVTPELDEAVDQRERYEVAGLAEVVCGEEEEAVVVERLEAQFDAQLLVDTPHLAQAQVRLAGEGWHGVRHSCNNTSGKPT